tara:strand:- start:150 stop:1037 length:888 start_codon:yes stop_codon:yes gene_type:complete
MERGEEQSNTPYEAYGGDRIAGFGADTEAGFQGIRDITGSGTPDSFTNAESALTGVAGQGNLAQQGLYDQTQNWTDAGVADSYMNPYTSNVLDVQQQRLDQRFNEQQVGREASATKAGAFGGDRRFIQDGIANRERNLQSNEMDAKGMAAAYQSGMGAFNQDRAARIQGNQLNSQIFAGNQTRGMDLDKNRINAAEQLRVQGLADDELGFTRAKNLAGVGGAYDAQDQQGMDLAYTDFLNQRDFDKQQLNYMSGIMRGVPVTPTQESTRYDAPPSKLSQLLGLGIGGLGLAKAIT